LSLGNAMTAGYQLQLVLRTQHTSTQLAIE
jgi:hypothetical protein